MEHYFTNNENLKSDLRSIKYDFESYSFMLESDLGVFSKDKIDLGSKELLENFLCSKKGEVGKTVLDVGCGSGLIGVVIAKVLEFEVDMIDINKRAIHLAENNAKNNNVTADVFESDGYFNIKSKYDYIVTNPPIRAGKSVYMKILEEAQNHLNDNGELWFVMHKDHGAKTVVKSLENVYLCQIIHKNKGFFIISAKKR